MLRGVPIGCSALRLLRRVQARVAQSAAAAACRAACDQHCLWVGFLGALALSDGERRGLRVLAQQPARGTLVSAAARDALPGLVCGPGGNPPV